MVAASVFLPSYNKKGFVLEAMHSILGQSSSDWELWVLENSTDNETRELIKDSGLLQDQRIRYVEIDFSQELRDTVYPTCYLLNRYYPQANGEFIFYLSDDDLLDSDCIEACLSHFEANPDHSVCYVSMWIVGQEEPGGTPKVFGQIDADTIRHSGQTRGIDGGMIVHRKSCLDAIPYPFFNESKLTAYRSDQVFVAALAEHYDFYPVPRLLAMHRSTPASLWTTCVNGERRPTKDHDNTQEKDMLFQAVAKREAAGLPLPAVVTLANIASMELGEARVIKRRGWLRGRQ